MTTAIHLASPDDAPKLLPMIAAFHAEMEFNSTEDARAAALSPLLEGSPLGAVWLFGPTRAPVGYIIITFSWSMELGGMDGTVDELFIRPNVRGRGIATEAISALAASLKEAGVVALSLEVDRENDTAQRLYQRAHFAPRERFMLMTRQL